MDSQKLATIQSFKGLIAAPFTAFKANGSLNGDIFPEYVDHLVDNGVTGVFVNGTTGEGLSLTLEERKLVAKGWVDAAKNKLELVIIQVGANCVKDAQKLAKHAETIGATGIASLPPLFYKYQTHDHLIAYFKKLADRAKTLPLMLYHIPSYSGVEIQLAEFMPQARQAIPNFCGATFTSTEVRDLLNRHRLPGEPFKLMSGFDEISLLPGHVLNTKWRYFPKYVDHLVDNRVTGVFVNGTTGEGLSLTLEERKLVAEGWVAAAKNKLELVIIQVGANCVKDAQTLAKHAEKIGATGIASLPPLFYKYQTHDHLIAYFKKLADVAPTLPLMLYHIPSYSGVE
ncbi:hypothetical protein JTE90_000465, partial [Oedothorax gibbosus]